MREKRLMWIRSAMLLAAVLILITSVRISARMIRDNLGLEVQKTLQDVSEQNVIAVEREIESKQQLLMGISLNQDIDWANQEALRMHLSPFVDIYQFKRMGFIYPDGTVCTTDGYVKDMSYRDYYQKGMQGKTEITDAMEESIGGENELINVFSVPVFDSGGTKVEGVLFATYRTVRFQDLLNIESFGGNGYSFIVKSDGSLITNSEKSAMCGNRNLFTALRDAAGENADLVEEIRVNMENGGRGIIKYWYGVEKYLYYIPLDVANESRWYIITAVPEAVLSERMAPIMRTVRALLGTVVVVSLASILLYMYSGHRRKVELMRIAYIDPLTGGDSYAFFQEKMKAKRKVPGFLVSLDIIGFKLINNTCGVKKGNEVIRRVREILEGDILSNELSAHVNADCFVLFLEDSGKEALQMRLNRIVVGITALSGELGIPNVMPVMGVYHGEDLSEVEQCYGYANQAKQQIKGRRDRNYAFYDELDFRHLQEVRMVEDNFDEAIRDKQFEVWYQPKYGVEDGKVVGAEALVRWRKKDGSLMPPGVFIPVLEKNGMIPRLDDYVFREVCVQVKEWEISGRRMVPVSVNISRVSLYYSNIVERYCKMLEFCELKPDYIQLEITESAVVDNKEIAGLIDEFKKAGFKLLLDDFGNGYSSLATLNAMQFDTLKLDKSLIDYIGEENGEKLLHYIIRLAQSLGLSITAEGVERKEQLVFLKKLKCDDVQGFYFSKPVPLDDYEAILDAE